MLATAGQVIEQLFGAFISWHTAELHRSLPGNRRYGSLANIKRHAAHVRFPAYSGHAKPVSTKYEPSLGEQISDIENSRLETRRQIAAIGTPSAPILLVGDRPSRANIRKHRSHFSRTGVRHGDGTGWLPREDSKSQMSNSNLVSGAKSGNRAKNWQICQPWPLSNADSWSSR